MPEFYPPSAEIVINAPLQTVWNILLDGSAYPDWNSFIPQVAGDLQTVIVTPPEDGRGIWIHEHASWLAKAGLVRSRRHHELIATTQTATSYRTWEPFSGLLKPFMPFAQIDAGFKTQAADLKAVCEN